MINSKGETVQNMEHTNSEMIPLTDAELNAITGGSLLGDLGRMIAHALQRNGDQRRPTS
jgi:bacteriocin-like protein